MGNRVIAGAAAAAVAAFIAGCGPAAGPVIVHRTQEMGSASTPASPWSVTCTVGAPDSTADVLPYTVKIRNNSAVIQYVTDIEVVFTGSSGQEMEAGSTTGPGPVLAGQAMTITDQVPGANPAYGTDSEPMNAVTGCEVISVAP